MLPTVVGWRHLPGDTSRPARADTWDTPCQLCPTAIGSNLSTPKLKAGQQVHSTSARIRCHGHFRNRVRHARAPPVLTGALDAHQRAGVIAVAQPELAGEGRVVRDVDSAVQGRQGARVVMAGGTCLPSAFGSPGSRCLDRGCVFLLNGETRQRSMGGPGDQFPFLASQ
jgi:hypothetical protein